MQAALNHQQYTINVTDVGFAAELRLVDAEKLRDELDQACSYLRAEIKKQQDAGTAPRTAETSISSKPDQNQAPEFGDALDIVRDREPELDRPALHGPQPTVETPRSIAERMAQNKEDAKRQPDEAPLFGPADTSERPDLPGGVDPQEAANPPAGAAQADEAEADSEPGSVDESMTRPELEAYAAHHGVDDPGHYKTKQTLVQAIRRAERA